MSNKLDPLRDGVDHINVYSRGFTELGQDLSNFAHTPFVHPRYGPFESVEGFWYWLGTGRRHDHLRDLWGFLAKEEGRRCTRVDIPEFEEEIRDALLHKVSQTYGLAQRLAGSTLPLCHYFYYGRLGVVEPKVVVPKAGLFQMEYLTDLRDQIRLSMGMH